MTSKILKKLKALISSSSSYSGWRKRRTSGVRKILSRADYATNYNKIQSLGVGSATSNIEYNFNTVPTANTQYGVNIGGILTGSNEFIDKMTHYRYFKIMGLVVVFEPSYIGTGAEYVRVQLNFNQNEADGMDTEDSTKIVPLYRTKKITLKYKIPNLICADSHGYLNYKAWLTRDVYNTNNTMPGWIWFNSTTGTQYALVCKIILRVVFRGSVTITASALKEEVKLLEKLTIKEQQTEDEKEESN